MQREARIKRLLFRSSHRGTKESDLLLGPYAEAHAESMSNAQLDEFESFLEENDNDIWDWLSGATETPRYPELIMRLRQLAGNNIK